MKQFDDLKTAIAALINAVEGLLTYIVNLKTRVQDTTVDPAEAQAQVEAIRAEIAKINAARQGG